MIHTISARSTVEAWATASQYLLGRPGRSVYNLILDIQDPIRLSPIDKQIISLVDDFLVKRGIDPTVTVAGTIFPASHYLTRGAVGVYKDFPENVYPKIKSSWGTYAGRILRRTDKAGQTINPLEILVNKIIAQLALPGPLRRAYELNTIDPFLDIPIYQASSDANLTMGQPCLSHLSFKIIENNKLMLTALYRSHYYLQRTLGNLLGLSQLHYFVAKESGLEVGELVCHSSFACLEHNPKWRVQDIKNLIAACVQGPL